MKNNKNNQVCFHKLYRPYGLKEKALTDHKQYSCANRTKCLKPQVKKKTIKFAFTVQVKYFVHFAIEEPFAGYNNYFNRQLLKKPA